MNKLMVLLAALALAACAKPAERSGLASVGQPAPQINLPEIVSGGVKAVNGWGDFKGKAVVLEFWSPDCPPCVENMPHLVKLAAEFKGKPVVFLSAALAPKAEVEDFLKTNKLPGIVAADTPVPLLASFRGNGIPHTVLVDANGVVQAITYPSYVTEKALDDLIAGKKLEMPADM